MFRDILVSIDGSPHSERALAEALDIAAAHNSRLTILTAVPRTPAWPCFSMSAVPPPRLDEELERESTEIMRAAVARVPHSVPVTTIITHRPIRAALREQVKKCQHDLLVMGSRGRGALRSSLLGSVSHHALNHSPIPVLIVHADEPTQRPVPRQADADAQLRTPGTESPGSTGSVAPA